jgi:hypothetical protein
MSTALVRRGRGNRSGPAWRAGRSVILAAALTAGSAGAAAAQTSGQTGDQTGGLWPPGSAQQRAVAPDCPTCWVQQVTGQAAAGAPVAAPANPTCYGQPSVDFFRTALLIVAPRTPQAASGDLAEAIRRLDRPMAGAVREGSGADFRTLLDRPRGEVPYANCAPLAALLPAGATVEAVAISVLAGGTAHRCDRVTGVCGDGGRFMQPPERFGTAERPAVAAVFMDAGAAPRAAQLSVAYRMADGATPQPLR